MYLPADLQELISYLLHKVRNTSEHTVTPLERMSLYKAFGPTTYPASYEETKALIEKGENNFLELTNADLAFGWLCLITARKVLPFWEKALAESEQAQKYFGLSFTASMLDLAKSVLEGTTNIQEAFHDATYGIWYNLSGQYSLYLTDSAIFARASAYSALCLVFLGPAGIDYKGTHNVLTEDKYIPMTSKDFALWAVKAYSVIDEKERLFQSYSEAYTHTLNLQYNNQKRREFWEWWLTVAIPQAWKLADTSR
ncbi:MAG TPA: Imm5 family immunity protein [Chloroflexia bacterium]|nr:Imm5 family immunity protein [Chloroflexia bacterium]